MPGEHDGDATSPPSGPAPSILSTRRQRLRRAGLIGAAFLVPCGVIALSVWSIARDAERRRGSAPPVSQASAARVPDGGVEDAGVTAAPVASAPAAPASESASPLAAPSSSAPEFLDETDDGEPAAKAKAAPKRYATVQQAAAESCTTESVEGLSKQIIEQVRCTNPNAFVLLPPRTNLVVGSSVFPYLERDARDHLLRVLDANPTKKMTINSALRTVAQQYLVSRWAAGNRCGVQLATRPGESNHELGSALDIAEPGLWRSALEAHDFKWLGASDRVHFDFRPRKAARATVADVLAFQILWNRNRASDPVRADGRYTAATEQRLKKAPAGGFPKGASCGGAGAAKRSSPR